MSTTESLSDVDTNDDSLEDEIYDNVDPDDSNFDENDDSNDFDCDENDDSNDFDCDENDDSNDFDCDENDDSNDFDFDENDDSYSWVNTETKAFHLVRHCTPNGSTNSNSSTPFLSDSLKIYLNAPPLIREIRNTGTYCLVMDPIADESERMPLSTSQLYVGNIPYAVKWYHLKNWFAERGCNVSRVDMKTNQVRITSVLINENEVFLLMEINRPPIILEIKDAGSSISESPDEKRLPGFGFIGHANVWLFKLASNDGDNNTRKLFQLLRDDNLWSGNLSESDIICSLTNIESVKKNLEPIKLISNDKWIRENQAKVDNFFNHRWSLYPFETKFEIMKLISKHIVTVHDLIVDEQAEHILQLCSINTLVALTDKIFEFALLWCAKTCDKEDEDWNNRNESEENQLPIVTDDFPIINDVSFISKNIRFAATGGFINAENAEIAPKMTTIKSLGLEKYSSGRLSRLFNLAFEKLLKNYELCRTANGIVLTRLELRTAKNDLFLTRKIYITPSTILYEGPYDEEKCAVTPFSSSQLREHSCWMFASPDDRTTVDTIREWMGDFRNVHPVAKLAARLGQLFSASSKGIQLESHQIKEISDEKRCTTEINGIHEYSFTDGIGIISLPFTKRLARTMKLPEAVCPCAFQIRCGGYKGNILS
ncbi:unnamed protein product [Rotaria sp. Silwood2]|nr:unnamed protein product [Rotaria sp. Silwood2]